MALSKRGPPPRVVGACTLGVALHIAATSEECAWDHKEFTIGVDVDNDDLTSLSGRQSYPPSLRWIRLVHVEEQRLTPQHCARQSRKAPDTPIISMFTGSS